MSKGLAVVFLAAGFIGGGLLPVHWVAAASKPRDSPAAVKVLDIVACGAIASDELSASGRVPVVDAGDFWKATVAANGTKSQIARDAGAWLTDTSRAPLGTTNVYPTMAVARDCQNLGVIVYGEGTV